MKIALDESGNSGPNLMIEAEPLLCLASVLFSDTQIGLAEEHFARVKATEWKFTKLKLNKANLELFLKFAELDWVNGDLVRINVVHKKYFAVTKMVDLIEEPLSRLHGIDLYEQGCALALANLMVTTLPVFLGEECYSNLLASFVNLARTREDSAARHFYEMTVQAYSQLEDKNCEFNILSGVLIGASNPNLWLHEVSDTELDPLVPSYFTTIEFWGQKLRQPFSVVSDQSKALAQHLATLQALSDPTIPSKRLPSVGGGFAEFPYRATAIEEACSTTNRAVQIADLFAGAANSVFSKIAKHQPLEPWQERFKDLVYKKEMLLGGYWPSAEITPEELGATHVTGEKVVDFVGSVLRPQDNV